MVAVRIVMGALMVLLAVVVAVPAIALIDLLTGGSGLGLCSGKLATCDTSFFTLLELALIFVALVAGLSLGITGCLHVLARPPRQPNH